MEMKPVYTGHGETFGGLNRKKEIDQQNLTRHDPNCHQSVKPTTETPLCFFINACRLIGRPRGSMMHLWLIMIIVSALKCGPMDTPCQWCIAYDAADIAHISFFGFILHFAHRTDWIRLRSQSMGCYQTQKRILADSSCYINITMEPE